MRDDIDIHVIDSSRISSATMAVIASCWFSCICRRTSCFIPPFDKLLFAELVAEFEYVLTLGALYHA